MAADPGKDFEMKEEKKAGSEKAGGKEKIPLLYPRRRIQVGLLGTFFGFLLVVLGAKPEFFGMDRSPVIGFIQTATFTFDVFTYSPSNLRQAE